VTVTVTDQCPQAHIITAPGAKLVHLAASIPAAAACAISHCRNVFRAAAAAAAAAVHSITVSANWTASPEQLTDITGLDL